MKIAVPVNTGSIDATISMRFARSTYFAVLDVSLKKINFMENPFLHKKTGTGKSIIELLINKYEINTILAYELGLMIQQVAYKKQIQLIITNEKNKSLKETLRLLKFKV